MSPKNIFRKQFTLPFDRSHGLPTVRESAHIIEHLGAKEKLLLSIFCILIIISGYLLVSTISGNSMVIVPTDGGKFTEAMVGTPRFVNPLLATTDTDESITSLVYAGLMKVNQTGDLVPDMAKDYSISEDGMTYTFRLREGLLFHDGTPLTAEDIVYTTNLSRENIIKSPERVNWESVQVEAPDAETVVFNLKQPYSPFLGNTTLGILPKHIWSKISLENFSFDSHNTELAIGSGPYKIESLDKDRRGVPVKMELVPFNKYALGKAYLEKITFRFYPNVEEATAAYRSGTVDSIMSLPPAFAEAFEKEEQKRVIEKTLPRVFALFFNQNNAEPLKERKVRQALELAIDKDRIVDEILLGYGATLNAPLPSLSTNVVIEEEPEDATSTPPSRLSNLDIAKELLDDAGWTLENASSTVRTKKDNSLKLSISTSDTPDLVKTAEIIGQYWEALGIEVEINVFERGDLNLNIIGPRKFEVLLFGNSHGRFPDLYAFYHSTQRLFPGVNIAQYTSSDADDLLESIQSDLDNDYQQELLKDFSDLLQTDMPVAFLYSPSYIYLPPDNILGLTFNNIDSASDRFDSVSSWYTKTDRVWKIFAD